MNNITRIIVAQSKNSNNDYAVLRIEREYIWAVRWLHEYEEKDASCLKYQFMRYTRDLDNAPFNPNSWNIS